MIWNPFEAKKEFGLGVDIGTSSIKVVELARIAAGKTRLTNYAELYAREGDVFQSSSVKLSVNRVAQALRQILRAGRIEAKGAAMSIPAFSGFITVISLPPMPEEELEQAVTYEAKKYIPLPLANVQFEWVKIAEKERGSSVLVVAVPNDLINKHYEIANASGLELRYLELDIFSLIRAFIPQRKEKTSFLIIDFGARSTTLSIVEEGWPLLTRTMDVCGNEFSRVLARALGMDISKAEQAKRTLGVDAGGGVLRPLLDSFLSEARGMIDEHQRQSSIPLTKVIYSGGSARMPGLLQYTAKVLQKEVVIGFTFDNVLYPNALKPVLQNELSPSLNVAVGLALREFNKQ